MDGCSEGLHSEVGAKLFAHLFSNSKTKSVFECFNKLTEIFCSYEDVKNHLLFTILCLYEDNENYSVDVCGDGYIIMQSHDDSLDYKKLGEGDTPEYYAYNFVNPEYLSKYKGGVSFNRHILSKRDYKAIGLASDGLEYILNSPFKEEFEKYFLLRKEFPIRRLINREHTYFKDDITIVI